MILLSNPDRSDNRLVLKAWLRPSAAWALAAAMASGAFALPIEGLIAPHLAWLAEPRYLCLLLSLLVGILTRPASRTTCRPAPEARWILLLWFAYAAYALARSFWLNPAVLTWDAAAPVILVPLALASTYVVIDTREQAIHFAIALLALLASTAIAFIVIDLQSGADVPFRSFYSSRTFFVGAVTAIFLAAVRPVRSIAFVSTVGLAVLLLYAGLASAMRASLFFYAASLLFAGCLLVAARQLRAILLVLAIGLSGYALHWEVNTRAIQDKVNAYSPVRPTSFDDGEGEGRNEACRQRMAKAAIAPPPGTDTYSCQMHFTIYDVDSRIRLLLQAINTNSSPVFGSGLGAYLFVEASRSASEVGVYKYPHNILAEVYHTSGLVGLSLIGASIVLVIALVLRFSVSATGPLAILAAIPAFSGLSALVGGNIYDARFLWLAPLLMAAFFVPRAAPGEGA